MNTPTFNSRATDAAARPSNTRTTKAAAYPYYLPRVSSLLQPLSSSPTPTLRPHPRGASTNITTHPPTPSDSNLITQPLDSLSTSQPYPSLPVVVRIATVQMHFRLKTGL
ncbi:hypothetical protein RIF29_16114 [Crotalaria pallida]|uniref:Uncharacterized protein n=1 Tax=Crotalaria pallida TaxID=3830 RepID=A0AAN9FLT0_CROPI